MTIQLFGGNGKMGRAIQNVLYARDIAGAKLGGVIDKEGENAIALEMAYTLPCDILIDVSHHDATNKCLAYALARHIPLLIATTGHTPQEMTDIEQASLSIPILLCENLSPGMRWLKRCMLAGANLFPSATVTISETHHISKVDSPSGTALRLEALLETQGGCGDIRIVSERVGEQVGTHHITFEAEGEAISICHKVYDRTVYAREGVRGALWLARQPKGLYRTEDMEGI